MNESIVNKEESLDEEVISRLVLDGDLRGLKPAQKVQYYRAICDRLGLDPATQPFKILKLQGGEKLYCDRSGAQQLNRKHGIGHTITAREVTNECYVVTARALQNGGRHEESIGAVPIAGLKGEALCNAMMKAETKAKRRSTLDLCGLGMTDESELGEWSAKGQTMTIEEAARQPVLPEPKSKVLEEVRKEMAVGPTQNPERWKDVICTYGKTDGKIRGKKLGQIHHMNDVMDALYAKFVDPQELKTIKESDQPLREGLIAWNTWRLEQAAKREAFEARRQEQVDQSWEKEESDEIPMGEEPY